VYHFRILVKHRSMFNSTQIPGYAYVVKSGPKKSCLRFCQLTDTVRVTNYRIVSYRIVLVQLLAPCIMLYAMRATMQRQTDGRQDDANNRSYCVAVRSANKRYSIYGAE